MHLHIGFSLLLKRQIMIP